VFPKKNLKKKLTENMYFFKSVDPPIM